MTLTKTDLIHSMWRRGNLSWKLWDQQLQIYNAIRNLPKDVVEVILLCARQFGKSHLGVILALEDCLKYPDRCILVMGPTIKQANEIVVPRMKKIIRDAPPGLVRRTKSEHKWYVGESEIVIGGFDTDSSSQRGKTVQNVYVEEIGSSNPDLYTYSMRSDIGPALTHSDHGQIRFLTTPPPIPDHPFVTETMVEAKLHNALYLYTIDDNKALSPEQYAACVKRCKGKHTIDFRREYLCEVVRDPTMLVIPDFEEARHVQDLRIPQQAFCQLTGDFGGVRDKTAIVYHFYDYLLDKLVFFDERVFPANTPSHIIMEGAQEMVAAWGRPIHQQALDAPGQVRVDIAHETGEEMAMPLKDDWRSSLNNLAVMYSQERAVIHPRCKFLQESARSGMFNKTKTDFARTEALGHCDGVAAMMYAARMQNYNNPYVSNQALFNANVFVRPEAPRGPAVQVAQAVQPKRFGSFKR